MRKLRVDAHQHFWQIQRGDYGWLSPDMVPLYQDYLPVDIVDHLQQNSVHKTVLVQAAPSIAETEFLLSLADKHDFIAGVVGWIDMLATDALTQLTALSRHSKLRGIRPMLQDIPDTEWMLQPQLTPVFNRLAKLGLCFDALVTPAYLPSLIRLLERHRDLNIVVDHGAKPNIADDSFEPWAAQMSAVASNANVFCKLSGLLNEAGPDAGVQQLRPYVDHLLKCFGPERLMWGSDWPVLNLVADYQSWHAITGSLLRDLNDFERDAVMGANAIKFYGLEA